MWPGYDKIGWDFIIESVNEGVISFYNALNLSVIERVQVVKKTGFRFSPDFPKDLIQKVLEFEHPEMESRIMYGQLEVLAYFP
jgi:hypothetical protein